VNGLVAVLLGAVLAAAALAGVPEFERYRAVQESLARVPPRLRGRWLNERGLELPGVNAPIPASSPNSESTSLRLVGKWGRGPSVEVTGKDSLVFLSLGSEVAIINFADTADPQVLAEVQATGLVAQAAVRDSFLYVGCNSGQAGIEVWNIGNPSAPVFRGRTPTLLSDFCVRDTFLYLTQSLSGLNDTFKVYSVASPANVYLLGSCQDSGDAVTVTNNAAFLADRWGLYSIDVSDPRNPHRVGSYSGVPIEVEARGNICCATFMNPNQPDWLRFSILNVSDPANIQPIASLDSAGGYDIYLEGQLAFISGYYTGGHEFEILNIGDSAHPTRVGSYATPGPNNGVWAINDWTRAYVADGFQGLAVLDLSNLGSPQLDTFMLGADLAEDITVNGPWVYVANEQAGLQILSVADPTHPVAVGNYDTFGFRPMYATVAARDSFAYVDSRSGGRRFFRSVDVSDRANPVFAGDCELFNPPEDIVLRDSFAYCAEAYRFQVVNVARPRQPVLVGSCVTGDLHMAGLWLQGNLAYLAGAYDGIYIVDVTDPRNPAPVRILNGMSAWGCCVVDTFLYVPDFDDSLHIWSVANLFNVYQVGSVHVAGSGYDVKVLGDYAYVGAYGLGVVNVADPRNPVLVDYYVTPDDVRRVVCDSGRVYAACWSAGVCIFDTFSTAVTEPSPAPTPERRVRLLGSVTNGRATIEFSGANRKEVYLQVFDIAGNRIGRADALALNRSAVTRHQIDLTGRAAGVYIVRVSVSNEVYQLRTTKLPSRR
jgi:hypothetical protein